LVERRPDLNVAGGCRTGAHGASELRVEPLGVRSAAGAGS